jgi:hypothetical protein
VLYGNRATRTSRLPIEVRKGLETGQFGAIPTLNILMREFLTNPKYADALDRQSKTLGGQLSNLKDKSDLTFAAIGDSIKPTVSSFISGATSILAQVTALARGFSELPQPIKDVVVTIGGLGIAGGPALFFLGSIATLAGPAIRGFQLLKLAIAGLSGISFLTNVGGPALFLTGIQGPLTLAATRMLFFAKAIGIAGAAFAGWSVGRWLRDITGLGDVIDKASDKVARKFGYTTQAENIPLVGDDKFFIKKQSEALKRKGFIVPKQGSGQSDEDYLSYLKDLGAIAGADTKVGGADKEAAEKAKADLKSARSFLDTSRKAEYNGVSKIADAIQTNQVNLEEHGSTAEARRLYGQGTVLAVQTAARAELKKNSAETLKDIGEDTNRDLAFKSTQFRKNQDFERETLDLRLKTLDEEAAYESTAAQQTRDAQLRSLETVNAQTVSEKIQTEEAKLAIEQQYLQKALAIEFAQIEIQRDRRIDALQASLNAGTISRAEFDQRQSAEVDAAYGSAARATLNTQAAISAASDNASQRSANLIRDRYQRTFDSLKHSAEGLFDALISRSQSLGDALKNILKTTFLTPIKDAVSNQIAARLTSLVYGTPVSLVNEKVEGTGPIAGIRRAFAAIGVGATPRFGGSKLELPGRIGDMQLVNNAVPVMIMNSGGGGGSSNGLGSGLALGLAGLAGLGAFVSGAAKGATSAVTGSAGSLVSTVIKSTDGAVLGGGSTTTLDQIASIVGGPGGTSGFAGPVNLGGSSSGGGGILGSLGGFAGGLKSFFGFGDYSVPLNGGGASTGAAILQSGSLAQKLTALGRSNAALLGGGLLAADGLRRGGLAGLGETTGGGALIGFKFGGPLGAAIGAGVGALAGTIRLFVKSGAEKVIEKVKSRYGLTIDKGYAQQIYQIAKQNYGGNIDVALGAKEVQDLLSLYAENTGQKFGVANTPRGVSLSQAGGRLTQDATYVNGSAYSFQSNSGLGVTGGIATSLLSAPGRDPLSGSLLPYQFQNSPNVTVIVQNSIPHQAVGEFLSGKVVETVAEQPRVVQKASNASLKGNFGRSNIQAALAPGVLTA